jgi:hypothetical protein
VVRIDGGVAEAEVAGGSPRKKPRGPLPRKKFLGEETFLLCLDRAKKATAEHGRMEPIELEGDPEDWIEGSRPKKAPPKTTKPPPPSTRRTTEVAISTRRRRSLTRTTTTPRESTPIATK